MEAALADAKAVIGHGVKTVVEPSALFLTATWPSRSGWPRRAAFRSCVHGRLHLRPPAAVPHEPDEDQIAELFVHDIEQGIQGTDIKAAFIKCACDEPGITPGVEKVHRAAARASKQTGKPIMAHSRPANRTGLDQMKIFEEEGVDPAKVQIAHTGDTDDLDYIEELLARGPLDRDGPLRPRPLPADPAAQHDGDRATRARLRRPDVPLAGLLLDDRLVPAGGAGAPQGDEVPKWSMTLLFEEIIPALKEAGMTDEQLDTMMVDNPRRWLTGE